MNRDRVANLSEQAAIFWPFFCAAVTIGFCAFRIGPVSWSAFLQAENVIVRVNAIIALVGATVARIKIDRKSVRILDRAGYAVLAFLMYSGPVAVYHVFTAVDR